MPGPSLLVLADGSIPRLPVSIDAASDRMSPKMLPVTMVSKDLGFLMICMAALSTYLHACCTLIASPHSTENIAKAEWLSRGPCRFVTASRPSADVVLHSIRAFYSRLTINAARAKRRHTHMCDSSTSGYCLPMSVTTSLHSMDTSKTLDFSTEHSRFWRFCASWNATWAMRSICTSKPVKLYGHG